MDLIDRLNSLEKEQDLIKKQVSNTRDVIINMITEKIDSLDGVKMAETVNTAISLLNGEILVIKVMIENMLKNQDDYKDDMDEHIKEAPERLEKQASMYSKVLSNEKLIWATFSIILVTFVKVIFFN